MSPAEAGNCIPPHKFGFLFCCLCVRLFVLGALKGLESHKNTKTKEAKTGKTKHQETQKNNLVWTNAFPSFCVRHLYFLNLFCGYWALKGRESHKDTNKNQRTRKNENEKTILCGGLGNHKSANKKQRGKQKTKPCVEDCMFWLLHETSLISTCLCLLVFLFCLLNLKRTWKPQKHQRKPPNQNNEKPKKTTLCGRLHFLASS